MRFKNSKQMSFCDQTQINDEDTIHENHQCSCWEWLKTHYHYPAWAMMDEN